MQIHSYGTDAFQRDVMSMKLYTLSPLHIGTGETLAPLDYVIIDDTFYRIGQDELFRLIRENIPNGAKMFSDWISEKYEVLRDERDNQAQSRLSNETNALSFFRDQGKEQLLRDYLRKRADGQPVLKDDDTRQQRGRSDSFQRFGEIRESIRTGLKNELYVPGTSIKGAIRTALMYDYLMRHGNELPLERIIEQQLKDRVKKERFAEPLEAEIFFCKQREDHRLRNREAQMDILKLLSVADAHANKTVSLVPNIGKINIYLVEKEQVRNTRNTPRLMASRQRQASYAEIIPAGQELYTEMGFDGRMLMLLLEKVGDEGVAVGENRYYIELKKKVQRLFNLNEEMLSAPTPAAISKAVLDHCRHAIAQFSQAQLQRQQEWLADYAQQYDPNQYAPRIEVGYAPLHNFSGVLLHLGYAAGFSATTVLLYFLERSNNRTLFERIMEKYELGKAPNQKGRYQPKISRFPKSRRLIEEASQIRPLGWLAILGSDEASPAIQKAANVSGRNAPVSGPGTVSEPVVAEYYSGTINYKRPPEVDAVVIKSGHPNQVKVYLTSENAPELQLQAYRSPLEVGTVVIVQITLNKTGKVLSAAYRKVKG